MKSIRTRLFLVLLGMSALTVAVLWIIQAGFMRDVYLNERVSAVRSTVREAARDNQLSFDNLADEINAGFILFGSDGRLVGRSANLPMQGMVVNAARSMVPDRVDGSVHTMTLMGGSTRYAILGYPQGDSGYLFAVFSLADLDGSAAILQRQLWIITLVLTALSILAAVILSRHISRPIQAVTRAARQLAAGNLNVQLPVRSADETGQLTEALNDLGIELGRTEQLRRELIANVSHELRSPLTIIQGYAETIRDVTWPDETKRTQQLDIISSEASRLTRIVKDILDYSRLQAGVDKPNPTSFSACPVLQSLIDEFQQEMESRGLQSTLDCPEVFIVFDRDRFSQVMHNLFNNAVNHATPGSTIAVQVQPGNRSCRIEVRNQGQPIPTADLSKIWERYYRSSDGNGRPLGTGLGLAIVRSICEQQNATYGVERLGDWTVFWLEAQTAQVTA